MPQVEKINDCVIRLANVNGTGSASANNMFAKAIFRMGVPVSPKNIFPSNIQGLPTWYEIRVNEKGYLARRAGIDIMVSVNPQSIAKDIKSVAPGGYFMYDSTKPMSEDDLRKDIINVGIPMTAITAEHYTDPRQRLLFKNMIYVGAVATMLDMEMSVLEQMVSDQFKGKEKLVAPNVKALHLGADYIKKNYELPTKFKIERRDLNGDRIMFDGNSACALGAVFAGATVASWYPITPSTSLMSAFDEYASQYRVDADGKKKYAFVQSEDELAAIGMAIGANWNGARGFTATSGPGISLMNEFLGLAYFAEIPLVLIDVQRGGPSTGMPTRTQQSDITLCAYASHGDTKHPMIFPSSPKECFELTAESFDLAEQLQTPIIVMTDLDLGMNEHSTAALSWDDSKEMKRGKVYSAEDLEMMKADFGRYLDPDNDALTYRTIPGTHPTKGSFFTRGTSRDEMAKYTEESEPYVRNMDRLTKKWNTIKTYMPGPEFPEGYNTGSAYGLIYFGTSDLASLEAADYLKEEGITIDLMRLRSFPFNQDVDDFIQNHDRIFVVEQNRDAQMRSLLINELEIDPSKLIPVLNYDGLPLTAQFVFDKVSSQIGFSSTSTTNTHDLHKAGV